MDAPQAPVDSYEALVQLLQTSGVNHRADAASQSVQIPVEIRGREGLHAIRWQSRDNVVQFFQTVLDKVPAEKFPVLEEALARLNHCLAIPGFDLNHDHGVVCFRTYLSLVPRGHVLPAEVWSAFRLAARNAVMFHPTLQRILNGESSPGNIVADAQRDLASFQE
jgi:hypothetical protein